MKKKNKKILFLLIGLVIVLIIVVVVTLLLNPKEEEKQIKIVDSKEAEKLYQESNNKCTDVTSEKDSLILYLVFGQLDKDDMLKDNISYSEFVNEAEKVLKTDDVPTEINNYLYDGYSYTLNNDTITREKSDCTERYVSKIYGYSNDENTLDLYIASAYIKDGKVYNFDNVEIGDYSKKTINKTLDSGTIKVYHYTKNNGNYILDSIKD